MKPADYDLRARACFMYANWIETGNPVLSAADAFASKQSKIVKVLTMEQHQIVDRLRELGQTDADIATIGYTPHGS